jgi:carboxylesterase type B
LSVCNGPYTFKGPIECQSASVCLVGVSRNPSSLQTQANIIRIHGGSFNSGSASAPGFSGTRIANEGNIIVVILQYRLGVLGYLPPASSPASKDPNLGIGDVILGLRWLRNTARDFGGDGGRVVLGGQSSGAHMIRGMSLWIRARWREDADE